PIGSASSLGIFWTSCSSSPSSFAVALAVRAHVVVFAGSSRIVILTAGVRVVTRDARVVAGVARVVAGGVRVLARICGLRPFAWSSRAVGGVVAVRGDRGIWPVALSERCFPTGRVFAVPPGRGVPIPARVCHASPGGTRLSVARGVLTGLIGVARPGLFLLIGLDDDRDRPGLDPHGSVRGQRTRHERGPLDLSIARRQRQRRGGDLLIRSPRNRQPEAGAFAGLAPDLQ